jgi:hypothetical protein
LREEAVAEAEAGGVGEECGKKQFAMLNSRKLLLVLVALVPVLVASLPPQAAAAAAEVDAVA